MIRGIGRKLWIGAGLLGLLAAALVAIPSFIDANAYKPEIIAEVKRATGRDVTIEGPVRLSLLPAPGVTLYGLRVSNETGAKSPDMVEAKSVAVRLSLLGLLTGELRPAEVILAEPRIVLQIDASGRPNWQFPATPGAKTAALPRLVIEKGTLTFSDARTDLSIVAANADISASAGSIDGPLSLAAAATVNDVPMRIDLAAGAKQPANGAGSHTIDVTLQAAGGRLSFAGTASELGPNARLTGRASASADNLVAFARALIAMAGQPQPPLPPLLAGRFRFDGPVELSPAAVSAKDFTLALGDDSGTGSLALGLTPDLTVEARFAASRLDLDRWLAALVLPDNLRPDDLKNAPAPAAPAAAAPAPSSATPSSASWLASLTANLALEVGEVTYRGKPVRNLALELQARKGVVAVPKFTANLPGDLAVQASSTLSSDPVHPAVSGSFSLEGQKLRETLSWLEVDVSSVPAGKLARLSMKGRMGSSAGNVTVSDAVFELDDLAGTGGILVAFTVPVSIVAHIGLERLDLDPYLPPPDRGQTGSRSPVDTVTPILALLGPSIGLKLKVDQVDWQGEAITGVELDVARAAGTLNLHTFKIASLAGARVSLQAAIANYWTKDPKANLAFDFHAPDIDRVLKLIGRPPSGVGSLTMAGGAAGSWEKLAVRDFTVDAMGWQVLANGVLAAPQAGDGSIKSVSWKGGIRVNGQPIEAMIDADLSGVRPMVNADLRTGVLDFGGLAARGRGAPRTTTVPESEPIGTPLLSVDGTLKVSAASLGGAPLPLGNAEIAATLKEGVLTIAHFTGGLDGGTIALSGVIDGSKPSLSFDLRGEASGIDLAQMLRRQSGSNEIGSLVRITIDGRLDATGIALRGSGTTIAGLRSSLAGGAELKGHVRARADRFMALLGSAATGAVGGAIDVTLGNIMSVLGDRGGVGAANLLNAVSLVLYRYVNHDSPLAGRVEIADGLLTDRDLTLRGNGATASIATRTDLSRATTDTTINFVLAEEPSAPYLIVTARGPIASPSFHAVRGQAKDPPGVFDKLPSLPHVTVPSIPIPHIPVPHIPNPFGR
jgi:AsmA family/AsmA-like C-terminal region